MSKRLFAFLALFAFAGLPGSAHSEGPGATVEIVKDQGRFKGQTTGGFKDGKAFFAKGVGAIAIKLPSGASCASVSGHLSGATSLVVRAREEGGHCQLSLDGLDEAGLDLAILVGQDTVQFAPKLQVLAEVASQPSAGDVVSNLGVSLAEALRCTPTISSRTTVYEKNRALFIVTPLGSVLAAPTESIDEDDVIEVRVLADPHLLPFLWVRRTSEIRTTVDLNIAGKGIKLPALPEDRAQAGGIPECEAQTFVLRDFAPGRGVVTITARIGDKSIDLGSFDFLVNRLYHGMLSFGPIASRAKGIRYNVVDRNGTSVIEEETAASDWVKGYAIFYTAFLHGRRDFEKPLPKKLGARVHPTVGFLLESSKRNALVGLSLEGPTILVTVGLHMTEGQRLLGQPGLAVGSPFSRPAVELPTRRVVDSGLFLSLNLDLRAAAALISAITQVGS